jgi:hypothetical protein
MLKWFRTIRIGILHATFHRNIVKAARARENSNIRKFKRHIYRAEDAWRKIVILTEKNKQTNG